MWDFHHPTPPLNRGSTPLESTFEEGLGSFSLGVFCSIFEDLPIYLLARLSLGHRSDTMLDEHDSPQWYDIVHFEHKLSWLCFGFLKRPHTNGVSIPHL